MVVWKMLLVVLGTYLHGFGYGRKGKIPKVYFGHNIVGHCKWVWVHTIVFGFCTLDQTGSKLLQIIFSKLLSESYSRISQESLCLHHQSTLSCFVSLQLLLNCDHQVTSDAGESPLKPPFSCAIRPFRDM